MNFKGGRIDLNREGKRRRRQKGAIFKISCNNKKAN